MTSDPMTHHHMTDPLPSCYRPPPTSAEQLAIHRKFINYYHFKQLYHQADYLRPLHCRS